MRSHAGSGLRRSTYRRWSSRRRAPANRSSQPVTGRSALTGACWSCTRPSRIELLVKRETRSDSRREPIRSAQEVDDVKRRAFLGLGLSVVLLGPEAAARASTDDWDRIAHAWAY